MSGFGGGGFTFGSPAGQPAQQPQQQQPQGFSFGTPTPATAAPATGQPTLSFGTAAPTAAPAPTAFNFGGGGLGTSTPAGGLSSTGGSSTQQQQPSLFSSSFGSGTQPAGLGNPPAVTSSGITGLGGLAAPTTATTTTQPTISFGIPAAGTVTSGTTPATTTAPTLGISLPNTTPLFSGGLGGTLAAAVSTPATTALPTQPTLTTATTTTAATSAAGATPTSGSVGQKQVPEINFRQLQELINKWTVELGEEERSFFEQATKVNAFDKTVMANGEKIAVLDDAVAKVKSDHTRLEHTLEYLKTQQQEFEAFLEPLEASLPPSVSAEPDRESLYARAENMDTTLQQMAEDLKEIIRHINDSNRTADKSDPVSQILMILNEHTDALQWVEDNSNGVKKSIEEVSKMHKMFHDEHEKSLKSSFHRH